MANDLEAGQSNQLLEWLDLTCSSQEKVILKNVSGSVKSGELLAVMGPSGAGKSTFLDLLANRKSGSGSITLSGVATQNMRNGTIIYVEQHDALLGVLTVEETIEYSARLSHPSASLTDINKIVQRALGILGLLSVATQRIGTPLSRGISGGQKRRVTIGCAIVSNPDVLLLDEPTSGLDSLSGREVVRALKDIARTSNIPIICSVHQPNWDTFSLFDSVLVLAKSRTVYLGSTDNLAPYMKEYMDLVVPEHVNPADMIIEALNLDFQAGNLDENEKKSIPSSSLTEFDRQSRRTEPEFRSPDAYADLWVSYRPSIPDLPQSSHMAKDTSRSPSPRMTASAYLFRKSVILTERNFLNYRRNILGYGVRGGMYLGMGVLLATIWVNLGQSSSKINDRLSVHFFSVAFLGFMSVAGIPTFLEERHVFLRERLNGLYSPLPYVVANSLVALPFLAACSLLFSVVSYWSIGLHGGAGHFFKFFCELFLAVYVAESQSVLVAAILPIFVAALAVASFLNGFWMCVQGYFIRAVNLPRFWYWWAHWIDYQTFAFNFLVNNDFRGLIFPCPSSGAGCECPYPSSLSASECALRGEDVLQALGIEGISLGLYAGLLIVIALFYRTILWVVLIYKKK